MMPKTLMSMSYMANVGRKLEGVTVILFILKDQISKILYDQKSYQTETVRTINEVRATRSDFRALNVPVPVMFRCMSGLK